MSQSSIIPVVAAVIQNERGEILITRRPLRSHLGGLWEFPGGKIDNGETPEQALQRELKEEIDVQTVVGPLLWEETFHYPEKSIHIRFFKCRFKNTIQKIRPLQVADFKWVPGEKLKDFTFPPADEAFIQFLQKQ